MPRSPSSAPAPFRTRTGQTGRDAYVYELAAIRNARRELDARVAALSAAMERELPGTASSAQEFGGSLCRYGRPVLSELLEFSGKLGTDAVGLDTLEELLRHLES